MLLLLIRHGDAGSRNPDRWPDDRLRPLTAEGREAVGRMAARLKAQAWIPEAVLTSPWARACQTAELLLDELDTRGRPIPVEALARAPDLEALQAEIGARAGDSVVAAVGHSPWLDQLASLLLTASPTRLRIDLTKGGLLAIRTGALRAGAGELITAAP